MFLFKKNQFFSLIKGKWYKNNFYKTMNNVWKIKENDLIQNKINFILFNNINNNINYNKSIYSKINSLNQNITKLRMLSKSNKKLNNKKKRIKKLLKNNNQKEEEIEEKDILLMENFSEEDKKPLSLEEVIKILNEENAKDLIVMDATNKCSWTQYFIIFRILTIKHGKDIGNRIIKEVVL